MVPADFPVNGYPGDYALFWVVWVLAVAATAAFFRRVAIRRAAGHAAGRARLVAGNLLVFGTLLWTAAVAGETYLRYVYDATDSYGIMLTSAAWFKRHVVVNAHGYRDRELHMAPRPGVVRVACVGDSFTMGWGVPDPADLWPQRVQSALAAARPGGYDVYNLGVPGADTQPELDLVEDLARRGSADRVVLGYCLNDVDDLMAPGARFIRPDAPRIPWIRPTRSFLADFLWFRLRVRSDPRARGYFDWIEGAYADPSIVARQTERLRRMGAACRAANIRLDVVVFPFFASWGDGYRYDAAHDRVAEACRAAGAQVVDLRDAYRGIPGADLVCNRYDGHPNARAHAIAAQVVLDRLFGVR